MKLRWLTPLSSLNKENCNEEHEMCKVNSFVCYHKKYGVVKRACQDFYIANLRVLTEI